MKNNDKISDDKIQQQNKHNLRKTHKNSPNICPATMSVHS